MVSDLFKGVWSKVGRGKLIHMVGLGDTPVVIQTRDWRVLKVMNDAGGYTFEVFAARADGSSLKACRTCAKEAHEGDETAITALLMCAEDFVLWKYFREFQDGKT